MTRLILLPELVGAFSDSFPLCPSLKQLRPFGPSSPRERAPQRRPERHQPPAGGRRRPRDRRFDVQVTLSVLGRPTVAMPTWVPLASQSQVMSEVWGWWVNSPYSVEL